MYPIKYYYTSMAKQFFIICMVFALLTRFALFFAGGFYKEAYVVATVLIYALALGLCVFLFMAWRLFYAEFDETSITWHNNLFRKSKTVDLQPVERAVFSKSAIKIYYREEQKPRMQVPYYCFGIISPVGVENFMNLMKNKRVEVVQEYKVLPGYGALDRWFARGYILIALLVLINSVQLAILVYLILTS